MARPSTIGKLAASPHGSGMAKSRRAAEMGRMTDIVSTLKRSQMMSGIRGKDTAPEMRVRRLLHRLGYRFRLHRRDLPGSPDIVLPKYRVAIFVHGCFWHFHQGCRLAKMPVTHEEFWRAKLFRNRERDAASVAALMATGWRVLQVWECFLRDSSNDEALEGVMAGWLEGELPLGEFSKALSGADV